MNDVNAEYLVDVFKRCSIQDTYALTTEILGVKKGETMNPRDIKAAIEGLREAAKWLEENGKDYRGIWSQIC